MDSYIIKNTKQFMSILLASGAFDEFFLESAKITTFNTFSIDGFIKKEFYSDQDLENDEMLSTYQYSRYAQVKPYIYEIIKGKNTPVSFQIILLAPLSMYENNDYEADVRYVLNIRFEDGKVSCVSAISRSDFTLDKTSDKLWDKKCGEFIEKLGC